MRRAGKHAAVIGVAGLSLVAVAAEWPAKVLDLSRWKLTLPVEGARAGRPAEIKQPELNTFADPRFFFVDATTSGVVFRAPCGGAVTKNSGYPRCELREMTGDGTAPAAWGTDDGGIHTLTATLAVTRTPPIKPHVVCAQIHDAEDDVLMIRLEGAKLFVERNRHGDALLDSDVRPGVPFDLKIQAGGGRIRVWHNGDLRLDWETARRGCYFKAGCYTQSNPGKGDAPDAYGEVIIHRLRIDHQTGPR